MKRNKRRRKCPFSPLTLLAALLLIGGMLAIILPVLQWDAEVSAEAGEYEQLRAQHQQAEEREMVEEETQNHTGEGFCHVPYMRCTGRLQEQGCQRASHHTAYQRLHETA